MGPRSAVLGVGAASGLRHWNLRWSSIWDTRTQNWVWETHAGCAPGTVGGARYWASDRCTGWGIRMGAVILGPSVELPPGPRKAAPGEGNAC
eukprot:6631325-Pyramimonas_sp.AAC.1